MKQGSTIFLRAAVCVIGLVVLAICVFALPPAIMDEGIGAFRLILAGLYVPAIPFFFALYQALKLLDYIDKRTAFSELSVQALRKIKLCAGVIALLFTAGAPYIYLVTEQMDPPVNLVVLIIIFASTVIGVFAALLQKLLQNVIDIKTENDLTV